MDRVDIEMHVECVAKKSRGKVTYPDFDLERDRDLEWEPSLERAGDRPGERLADFPEPLGLTLRDAERDS